MNADVLLYVGRHLLDLLTLGTQLEVLTSPRHLWSVIEHVFTIMNVRRFQRNTQRTKASPTALKSKGNALKTRWLTLRPAR